MAQPPAKTCCASLPKLASVPSGVPEQTKIGIQVSIPHIARRRPIRYLQPERQPDQPVLAVQSLCIFTDFHVVSDAEVTATRETCRVS